MTLTHEKINAAKNEDKFIHMQLIEEPNNAQFTYWLYWNGVRPGKLHF